MFCTEKNKAVKTYHINIDKIIKIKSDIIQPTIKLAGSEFIRSRNYEQKYNK